MQKITNLASFLWMKSMPSEEEDLAKAIQLIDKYKGH